LNRNYILRSMQVIKEDIERAYRNANMKPLKHSAYLRLQALKERFWHADDKLACLLSLTVKDVTDFIPQLFNQTYIEALCHGNLDEEEALKIANIFKQTLVKNVLPPELRPQERIIKLPIGSSLLHSANVKNESEENSVVEMYFQGEQDLGRDSIRTRGIIDLFEQMIYEPCFNQLRSLFSSIVS
jgi:nardilysin